jgi:hypothetical protein
MSIRAFLTLTLAAAILFSPLYLSLGETKLDDRAIAATLDEGTPAGASGFRLPAESLPSDLAPAVADQDPEDVIQLAQRGYYGAIAATIWESGSQTRVATGVAWNYPTAAAARRAAIKECVNAGGRGCKIQGNGFHNGGCGYVTTGNKSGGVCWGIGATAARAVSECRKNGCTCKAASGGCTARP